MNILFARNLKQGHTPPPTPTNEDRYQEFRNVYRALPGNSRAWKWHRKH